MPINVFGNSSSNSSGNKIDTSLFVKKPYLRSNYIETDMEENLDFKNQYQIKNLPNPTEICDACNKNYVDNIFKNDIDFNDVKLVNINTITLNKQAQNDNEVITKAYVDRFHQVNE